MQNVSVTTTPAEVLPEACSRGGKVLLLQNVSDTPIRLAFGVDDAALLSATLGITLAAGATMTFTRPANLKCLWAVHGGSGDKTLFVAIL